MGERIPVEDHAAREARFERMQRIADALFERYRGSPGTRSDRWSFGTLAPNGDGGASASTWMRCELLVESSAASNLFGRLRFLHLERVHVEERSADCERFVTRERGIARAIDFTVDFTSFEKSQVHFELSGERGHEPIVGADGAIVGRVIRETEPVRGVIHLDAFARAAPLVKVRILVENTGEFRRSGAPREEAFRCSLIGAHLGLVIENGAFVSLRDPSPDARELAAECESVRMFPVLAGAEGDRTALLASPFALCDHPMIAPESAGEIGPLESSE